MQKKVTISILAFLSILCAIAPLAHSQTESSGTWTSASSTGFPYIYWHTASTVNNKIYVIGGWVVDAGGNSSLDQAVHVYDPSTDTWDTLVTTGKFTPRAALASTVVDGKIYVLGGVTGPESPQTMSNKLEVLDLSTNTWSTPVTTGKFTKRDILCACVVNGKIYAIGGYDAVTGDLSTLEVFDPSTNTWSTPTTSGTFAPRGAFTAQVVNDKIYVMGGLANTYLPATVQTFDPSTNTWSTLTTTGTFTPRLQCTSGVVNGKIYVIGGGSNQGLITNVQVFDPATNAWSTSAAMGTFSPRAYLPTSSGVVGGQIYVMGGYDGGNYVFDLNDVYTPATVAGVKTEDAASLNIELSPNPTNGLLTIYNAPVNTQVTIENIVGKTVIGLGNSETPNITLDLSKLPAGTYFARIVTPTLVVTREIVRM